MAITANTIYEFQSGGSDANGGGFDSTIANAGTDYSTSTTAQATLTTASVVAATTTDITVSAGDYTVASTDIGNIFYLTGGSATAGFYQVVSLPGGNVWRMDRSLGTAGQTCPGKMGGCRNLLSSNSFPAALVAGNKVYVKNGSYSLASFGSQTAGTISAIVQILGYNSTRDDNPTGANRPTLTMAGNTFTLGNFTHFRNFIMTGSATQVLISAAGNTIINSKVTSTNATATSIALNFSGNNTRVIDCEVIAASCIGMNMGLNNPLAFGCYVHGCTTGIKSTGSGATIINNIVSACTTAISLQTTSLLGFCISNNTLFGAETPAGTGIDGSTATAPARSIFLNNIIYGFVTGVNWQASTPENWWDYNDFFNNTTNRTNVTAGPHDVAIDPGFTSSAGGDFSITGAI